MTTFVVRRDGDVDEFGWGVGITEGDDGNVDVGCFLDSLSVGARIGDDDEARLFERAGDVIGEISRGETPSNGDSAGVGGELEDSTLAIGAGRNYSDVGWVVNCGNDASCENNLLPTHRF